LQADRDAIAAQIRGSQDRELCVDLTTSGSEERLFKKIFENRMFSEWAVGSGRLYLYLDGLDECLLKIGSIAAALADEFPNWPTDRLFLRIACRTADWPPLLERRLPEIWGKDRTRVVELVPLRRQDVITAAEARGLDTGSFLEEVRRVEAVPLAIKPVTLDFLLDCYRPDATGGCLPNRPADLYSQGCRILCEELSESRRSARPIGTLSADERLSIASRIAAIMVFCGRQIILTGPDLGNVGVGEISVRELTGGEETTASGPLRVTETAVREVLNTGLFTARGSDLGWAHQTYAEYLAARYLHDRGIDVSQRLALITHPADGRLVPQLQELAAWLAGMEPEVFRRIVTADPVVLLGSDVATADVTDRERLVLSLLESANERWWLDGDGRRRLRKLCYPGMDMQIRPYILDRQAGYLARSLAVDIAEACELREVQGDLLNVALDGTDELVVRIQAACAVSRIGDTQTRLAMRPLIGDASDRQYELRGYALAALWPEHLTAYELFPLLDEPPSRLFGAYYLFLRTQVLPHLAPRDLLAALHWAETQIFDPLSISHRDELLAGIVELAWENLDEPGVLDGLANIVISRMRMHDRTDLVPKAIAKEEDRRRLVAAVARKLDNPDRDAAMLAWSVSGLVGREDIPWLLDQLDVTSTEKERRAYAKLIGRLYSLSGWELHDLVVRSSLRHSELTDEFAWFLEPVFLGSERARAMQEHYEFEQEVATRRHRTMLTPSPAERIVECLDQFEKGELSGWWRLNMELTLMPESTHYGSDLNFDLTSEPGWRAANAETQDRITSAAEQYLHEGNPDNDSWFGTNILHRPALAGYRALHLIQSTRPEALDQLPRGIWEKWAASAVGFPVMNSGEEYVSHCRMVARTYRKAPGEVTRCLMRLIETENAKAEVAFSIHTAELLWDEPFASSVIDVVQQGILTPANTGFLLGELLAHIRDTSSVARDRAIDYALGAIQIAIPAGEPDPAVTLAKPLLAYEAATVWPTIWPLITSNEPFGRALVERVALEDRHAGAIGRQLTEDQLADLYLWLLGQYPHESDPHIEGVHTPSAREEVALWREVVLRDLQQRGTIEASIAVARIVIARPDLSWLRAVLTNTQEFTRRSTWSPLEPSTIIRLAADANARLVRSADELLEVVIQSLGRLQTELQGETPTAELLWNKMDNKRWRPKDEDTLSNYVKTHLTRDVGGKHGIVANREVQIRRPQKGTMGQDTDIHVDAVIKGSDGTAYDTVSVIVETKGSWNRELDDAMETQLVNRYLARNQCRHGIYLVGWFVSAAWDDTGPSKQPSKSITDARTQFEAQAIKLSVGGLKIRSVVLDVSI
jgi:hypothetical protein